VLDPQVLCAQQVRDLYAQRWRIEEAFLLTKRLLRLAYLWVIVNLTPMGIAVPLPAIALPGC